MRIFTKTRLDWDEAQKRYFAIPLEWFEYEGPLDLFDRGQSKQVANQGMAQSAENQTAARTAVSNTNAELGGYKKNLGDFMSFGRRTYGKGGEFMRTQSTLANTTAAAGARGLEGDLLMHAMRTGQNTGGFAPAVAEYRRQNQRDLTDRLAQSDAARLAALSHIEETGLDASKFPAQVESSLYGPAVGGASSNLSVAGEAAKTPGFWDQFSHDLISAGGQVAAGYAAGGCWIAEAIYGVDDPRTHLVRLWLNVEFVKSTTGRMVMALYLRFGQRVASWVRRSTLLKHALKPLFDRGLKNAIRWGLK